MMELTKAQFRILRHIALTGASIREAACHLDISEDTARSHVSGAYARLRVADRWEAFRVLGWLRPEYIPEVWAHFDTEPVPVTAA